jgi:hypothetical protein
VYEGRVTIPRETSEAATRLLWTMLRHAIHRHAMHRHATHRNVFLLAIAATFSGCTCRGARSEDPNADHATAATAEKEAKKEPKKAKTEGKKEKHAKDPSEKDENDENDEKAPSETPHEKDAKAKDDEVADPFAPLPTKYPTAEAAEPATAPYARSGPNDATFQFHITGLPAVAPEKTLKPTFKWVPESWSPHLGSKQNFAGRPVEYVTAKGSLSRDYQYSDSRPGGHLFAVWHAQKVAGVYRGLEVIVLDASNRYAFTQGSATDAAGKYVTDSRIVDVDTLEVHRLPQADCIGVGRWIGPRLVTYTQPANAKDATPICVFSRKGELLSRLEAKPHKPATFSFIDAELGVVRGDPHLFYAVDKGSLGLGACELYVVDLRTGDAFHGPLPLPLESYCAEESYDIAPFTFADPKVRVRDGENWKSVVVKKKGP